MCNKVQKVLSLLLALVLCGGLSIVGFASNTYLLKNDLNFRAADIKTLEMVLYAGPTEQHLIIADEAVRAAVLEGLGKMEVRVAQKKQPPKTGGGLEYRFTLKNGKTWTYYDATDTLQDPEGNVRQYQVKKGYSNGLLPFDDLIAIPRLRAKINETDVKVLQDSFSYNGNIKTTDTKIPIDLTFEQDPFLPVGGNNLCILTFGMIKPTRVTPTLYREQTVTGAEPILDNGMILPIQEGKIVLPNQEGKYYLSLNCQFPGGDVTYILEFRVSILPEFFDSIQYCNESNGVTVIRDDRSISVPGKQNRDFVNLIWGLGLQEGKGSLTIEKPITLRFQYEGRTEDFRFTPEGILYRGKTYLPSQPEHLEDLYRAFLPATHESLNTESIDHKLRGFLTKEVSWFPNAYPMRVSDIQKLVINEEKPDQYISYDVTDALGKDPARPLCGLEEVVVGKPWNDQDAYFPRRFYLSFDITMKDGTTYQIGKKVLKNGQPDGWYTVFSNSAASSALIQSRQGTTYQREEPISSVIQINDDGTVNFQ